MIRVCAPDTLLFANRVYRCAIGKGGFSSSKREGDGCTPLGVFPLRECWYRADRMAAPITLLPLRVITPQDGWCDDPQSAEYNRHIIIPPVKHEPIIPSPLRGEGQGGGVFPLAGFSWNNEVFENLDGVLQRIAEHLTAITPTPTFSPPGGGNLPYSFEHLWREEAVYDLIIPLGYNDDPIMPGLGSAIFMHVAKPDYAPTEGCVALAKNDLLDMLKECDSTTRIHISNEK